jgi:hypothetical protein
MGWPGQASEHDADHGEANEPAINQTGGPPFAVAGSNKGLTSAGFDVRVARGFEKSSVTPWT